MEGRRGLQESVMEERKESKEFGTKEKDGKVET